MKSEPAAVTLSDATSDSDFGVTRSLFEEYAAALGVSLCFQNFAQELDNLRQVYGPPGGCIILARNAETVIGCVALRPFGARGDVCEMKRLYVRPSARGLRMGRLLVNEIIKRARLLGYRRMVLDTLDSMQAAQQLYRSIGFREFQPDHPIPVKGLVYMELVL
jgi:ribosomal protein S18 acetylase RimI-like enzyme